MVLVALHPIIPSTSLSSHLGRVSFLITVCGSFSSYWPCGSTSSLQLLLLWWILSKTDLTSEMMIETPYLWSVFVEHPSLQEQQNRAKHSDTEVRLLASAHIRCESLGMFLLLSQPEFLFLQNKDNSNAPLYCWGIPWRLYVKTVLRRPKWEQFEQNNNSIGLQTKEWNTHESMLV